MGKANCFNNKFCKTIWVYQSMLLYTDIYTTCIHTHIFTQKYIYSLGWTSSIKCGKILQNNIIKHFNNFGVRETFSFSI